MDEQIDDEQQATGPEYFAAVADWEELGAEVMQRVREYDAFAEARGLADAWRRSYRAWYGLDEQGRLSTAISLGGRQGELVRVPANHYRNLGTHLKALTIQHRPRFEARAVNTDPESVAQTHVAQGVLEYYLREQRLEDRSEACVERAIMFGEGFCALTWDQNAGAAGPPGPDGSPGTPVGDVRARTYGPMDVIRDIDRAPQDQQWLIVRDTANRHDLIATYPEHADEIAGLASRDDAQRRDRTPPRTGHGGDDVPIYWFFHAKTAAVPEGRYALVLADDLVLHVDSLPYEQIPVYRIAVSEFIGGPFGYSHAWDMLGLQEAVVALLSTIKTSLDAFGVQNVVKEHGTNVSPSDFEGLRLWTIPKGAMIPQGVNLTNLPEGWHQWYQLLVSSMELLSGVNAVARGNTEAVGKAASGAHLALLQTMAIQFNSGLQVSFARFMEDLGTGLINILKTYAQQPRLAQIAGRDNRHYVRAFTGADVNMISRVVVDTGNPMLNTHDGRIGVIKLILEAAPGVLDPAQIVQVLTTGNLQTMIGDSQRELDLIRSENDALASGPPVVTQQLAGPDGQLQPVPQAQGVPALRVDEHAQHIEHHKAVLSSPESRRAPRVVGAVLAHIQEHEFLAAAAAAPPAPSAPPQGKVTADSGAPSALAEQVMGTPQANLPSGPKNPLTGQAVPVAADTMGG